MNLGGLPLREEKRWLLRRERGNGEGWKGKTYCVPDTVEIVVAPP